MYSQQTLFAQDEPQAAPEQFRMAQLQVYDWGTFSGLHTVPIAQQGFLFVGRSGSGKSTLLDAFSALLVPPRWVNFNAAARDTDKSGRDRNLVSYIRGAWAEQKDEDSGEIATRCLRAGTTWSALGLTYRNAAGQSVVLVQIFWLRGSAGGSTDVKRYYLIFERPFDLQELEFFSQSNLDIRKLKQSLPDAFVHDEFSPYCERFRRLLGIESEMALRLLHKTQSAKNLGDLNTFLREFMLDKPKTFEVADRLVNEFDELSAAHQSVVTARQQVETLVPARETHRQRETALAQRTALKELQEGIDIYRKTRSIALLKGHIANLTIHAEALQGETAKCQGTLGTHTDLLRRLERQHREMGGDQIDQWEDEKKKLEDQRTICHGKRNLAETACRELNRPFSDTPQGFAELVGQAREEIEGWNTHAEASRNEHLALASRKQETEKAHKEANKEVQALLRQPSNIPAAMLELRSQIAAAIGLSDTALPFIGELIEVKPEESSWQGAIERVLHGFALSLLVDDNHYTLLSNHINTLHLGQRLVYYRACRDPFRLAQPVINTHSLVLKLNVKEGNNEEWLQTELLRRFDYACVESMQAFRAADRALTREGQVKHSQTRFEKDDRRAINDRRHWVLGFNNHDKLALYQEQVREYSATISNLAKQIAALIEAEKTSQTRMIHCQTLVNLRWQEIDIVTIMNRISTLDKLIYDIRSGNSVLQQLADQIKDQENLVSQAEKALSTTGIELGKTLDKIKESESQLGALEDDPTLIPLTPHQQTGLDERYGQITDHIRLNNLDNVTTKVVQSLSQDIETINHTIAEYEKHIETIFTDFKRTWPMDASDFDNTLMSAQDYFAKLARLETDGLPAHEQRFFDLLQNQSHQNLAALSTHLNNARKDILERMELVNDGLSQVPFNQTTDQRTTLHIDASDRQLPEVREFKQNIQQALSHAWSDDREFAESRFLKLRQLVEHLSGQDPEQKRWRESVLDVRQHVEFIGREIDENGIEIEVYRSGAGKSGGQRQKLATTCLAAALRYQLGGNDQGFPLYAPVVLDEAFDKTDNEFTTLVMNIFNNFGFQMIVATPLKSVMTLEPFIGGACFVDIRDRRVSGVLHIEYDSNRQRLNLSPQTPEEEASLETS